MDQITEIYNEFVSTHGIAGLATLTIILLLFLIQGYYLFRFFNKIPKYRNDKRGVSRPADGISVIVILGNDFYYLENTLPILLSQKGVEFEIMVVEVDTDEEFSDEIAVLKSMHKNISSTRIDSDPRFPLSNKMAYNVGIKGCRYSNIILTTSDTAPQSDQWLACMAKGFANGDVVLGYCGLSEEKGLLNALMRTDRMFFGCRYLSAAIAKMPYRGLIQNIGFSKEIYFSNKGFTHLNMNIGEDDLFIQKIADKYNTSVVMNPKATLRQKCWGGASWWFETRKSQAGTVRYYSNKVKLFIKTEVISRGLFLLAIIYGMIFFPPEIRFILLGLFLLRELAALRVYFGIRKRLHEKLSFTAILITDLFSPFYELCLAVIKKFNPSQDIYR